MSSIGKRLFLQSTSSYAFICHYFYQGIAFFVTHISLDVLFDEDLNDRTSNAFMNLQEEICEEVSIS